MTLNIRSKAGYLLSLLNWNIGKAFFMDAGTFQVLEGGEVRGHRKRLCIFAHYSDSSQIARYVLSYLEALAGVGMDIVFVSSSPDLPGGELEKISPLCRLIVKRENRGYDFGSWKVGLEQSGDLEKYEEVILANDSVYGPLFPLGESFGKMESGRADFWGITDSWMPQHHLQSYFMVFTRPVFTSPAFLSFWKTLPFFRRKKDIIIHCEVRLTEHLEDHGFRCGAVIPYGGIEILPGRTAWDMRLEVLTGHRNLNPTHFFWRVMIEKYRHPFLKVELLRENPVQVQDLHLLPEVLESFTDYKTSLIDEHLSRPDEVTPR